MAEYIPSQRYHEVTWMLKHSEDLEKKALKQLDTSKILYACLELRNAIEMLDFHLILASVPASEHNALAELAKNYHGIDKANNKLKSLKEKTQKFYECVCEELNISGKFYDYKKSHLLKTELSQYIHTYTRLQFEMQFDSVFMKKAFIILKAAREFIRLTLIEDGDDYKIQNLDFTSLSNEDKKTLEDWKQDRINEEELRKKISESRAKKVNQYN